jgi:hypothetical protein
LLHYFIVNAISWYFTQISPHIIEEFWMAVFIETGNKNLPFCVSLVRCRLNTFVVFARLRAQFINPARARRATDVMLPD